MSVFDMLDRPSGSVGMFRARGTMGVTFTHLRAFAKGNTASDDRSRWTLGLFAVPMAWSLGSEGASDNELCHHKQLHPGPAPVGQPLRGKVNNRDSTSTKPACVIQLCSRSGALGSFAGWMLCM
jgi:hypothetical protein